MQSGPHITRQKFVSLIMAVMWLALAVKTGIIQIIDHDRHYQKSVNQSTRSVTLKAERGTIMDRNGAQMAVTLNSASYAVWPRKVAEPKAAARVLSEASGLSYDRVMNTLTSKKNYVYLLRNAELETMRRMDAALDSLNDPIRVKTRAFDRLPEQKRRYPLGKIGSHVIGYTDVDSRGIEGLEKFFDRELAGSDGRSVQRRDAMQRTDGFMPEAVVKARDGLNLKLTIDSRIQEIAEAELEAAVDSSKAKYGGLIILDSSTGEILAMANAPRFNPNDPASFNALDPNLRRNRLVTDMLEPGSTFKIVTFAEALETGVISEDDPVNCHEGKYRIGNHTINDSHDMGVVPARDVLIHSSNIGTVEIAQRFGKMRLYERARMFGFGEVTGSDFPNETGGSLPNPRNWSNLSLPTISFGQGVAVSPLQLAAAYGAIANGGEYLAPRIIKEVIGRDGRTVHVSEKRRIRRVMSENTAARLSEILCQVVEMGTGRNAAVPGVRLAGKTGTAQRIEEGGKGYAGGKYVASFVGFIADRQPRLVCLVMIDSPVGVYYGAQVAGPVFRKVINQIVNLGGGPLAKAPAGNPEPLAVTVQLPDVSRMPVYQASRKLREAGFTPRVVGDPTLVVRQFPLAGAKLKQGSAVTLYTSSFTATRGDSVSMPDLTGKSLREAVADLKQAKLDVNITGSGVVQSQFPQPGALVASGTVCEVLCGKRQ
ncbi:MAG: penicillin-binding transpeptidase domain-containing protein [Candidatus Latescibacterota bacterium]